MRAFALTVSSRAAAGVYADLSGAALVKWLGERGFEVESSVVPDGPDVEASLRAAVDAGFRLVVTTGGTGVAPTDRTPEATRAVIELELPGFGEELRRRGAQRNLATLLSRGIAGTVGRTLVVNLPGSPNAVREGLDVLDGFVEHALEQLDGGDHLRRPLPEG